MSLSDILLPGLPFFIAKRNLAEIATNAGNLKRFVSGNDDETIEATLDHLA